MGTEENKSIQNELNDQTNIEAIMSRLRESKQYEQKTPAWYDIRKTLVTASDASAILRRTGDLCEDYISNFSLPATFADGKACNPYCSRREYTLRKFDRAKSFGEGSVATQWGNRFEEVACNIYQRLTQSKVELFGLLLHPKLDWLAASPDGVSDKGLLLEIKCPYKRRIDNIPPFHYWVQVQIQLEVMDLPAADFFQVEFIEYRSKAQFLNDEIDPNAREERGLYVKKDKVTSICPPVDMTELTDLIAWAEKTLAEGDTGLHIVYWKMIHYENTRILRSKEWFEKAKGSLHRTHTNIKNIDPQTLPNYNIPPEEAKTMRLEDPAPPDRVRRVWSTRREDPTMDICGGTSDGE